MNSPESKEKLFIKILAASTVFMLAFVLAVFMIGGNARRGDADTENDITDAGAQSDAPVYVPEVKNYIPRDSAKTERIPADKLDADYAILADIDSGSVIASSGADRRIYPASMTKVMTIIVCCENISDMSQTAEVRGDIVNDAYRKGASCAGFVPGEVVTVRDLLYGAALPSGADATGMLAVYLAGNESAFADMMNCKAGELGLKSTHFVNASGLHDDNHYTTVREMAAIMAYAMGNPLCSQFLSARTYTTSSTSQHPNGITLYSTAFSRMSNVKFGNVTLTAAKTGYTDEAQFCIASYGEGDDGKRYVVVTAHGSDKYAPVYDCKYLYGSCIK